ncbi:serine--tRNA ligase, partial [Rickettsiales bacterium]|nr:serine--tRNA ligase [Rickettsiales bacterium]
MLDIKWIRDNPEKFNESMGARGANFQASELINLDEEKRSLTTQIQDLQNQRNNLAKEIANKKRNKENADNLIANSKEINDNLKKLTDILENNDKLNEILATIPNILDQEVPFGESEDDNKEIEKWGEIRQFNFKPKEHYEIGENLGQLDFEQSAKISGSRFSTLSGNLAKLERALSNFMLDIAAEFNYQETSPPNLVKDEAMFGSGQLPKFAQDAFCTNNGYWLIPTAEVSLVNSALKKTFKESELPIRLTAYTPCFRSEAGAAGKDTRGMIRQHQFKKVELISITNNQDSKEEHERMTKVAQEVLKRLNLPHRKMLLCSKDTGFGAQKTYDLEVWLPGQEKYREISSCSNCGD